MSTVYHRVSSGEEPLDATYAHVVETLSSMVSPTDDPNEFADEVEVSVTPAEYGKVRIFGKIDRDPTEYTLAEDYVEPARNRHFSGFGVREMSHEELEKHLLTKGVNK